jgi:organic hydroperoxide reductase OsmC/OhrA
MANHLAAVRWERGEAPFTDGQYSRAHTISFDGGVTLVGSASPHVVKAPLSREDAVDPEELLVAALSACHMLVFLDLARRAGHCVDRYEDNAEGRLSKDDRGRLAVTEVTLRPRIAWAGAAPSTSEIDDLHHKAHDGCFIANSFRGDVCVEAPQD